MVKSMDLLDAEFFIAVLAAFHLLCSCTELVFSFRVLREAEDGILLDCVLRQFGLSCMFLAMLSSARALGPSVKWARVTNSTAPHIYLFIYKHIISRTISKVNLGGSFLHLVLFFPSFLGSIRIIFHSNNWNIISNKN